MKGSNKEDDYYTKSSKLTTVYGIDDSGIGTHRRGIVDNDTDNNDTHENETDGGMDNNDDSRSIGSIHRKRQGDLTDDEMKEEAEMWKGVGNRHMASQEYSKAYSAYSTCLSLSPLGATSHIYLSNRAASLLSLKRYSAASVDARRAITLAPTFGKAHARLGQSLYFLKDYNGAVRAYEDAFTYEPENQVTWTYLNKAKRKLERRKSGGGGGRVGDGGNTTAGKALQVSFTGESVATDMMSVTDSINLQNMKITIDDESDKRNIDASVMKDHSTTTNTTINKNKNRTNLAVGFYDDSFDFSTTENDGDSNNNRTLRDRMQKAVGGKEPPHQSFRNSRNLRVFSSLSHQNQNNESKQGSNDTDTYENDAIDEHNPSDETEENSVYSQSSVYSQQPIIKNRQITNDPQLNEAVNEDEAENEAENEDKDAYPTTTTDDPDFDEAVNLQQSASEHLLNRRYKVAIEEFSAALFLVPDDDNLTPSLFVGRAYALNGEGRHVSAQNDAMMALGRKPDLVDGHVALARSLFYAGDYKGAVRSFENARVCLQRIK